MAYNGLMFKTLEGIEYNEKGLVTAIKGTCKASQLKRWYVMVVNKREVQL